MKKHSSCETRIIAQSKSCCITLCEGCQSYHLHIGPISLRLKAEAFEDICETLVDFYRASGQVSGSGAYRMHSH
jgi:hypothetical protein